MTADETQATRSLRAVNALFATHTYDPGIATALEAARALAIEPSRMFKSLVVRRVDGQLVLAVVPVPTKVNLSALAQILGAASCALADKSVAEKATNSKVGEISPFGLPTPIRTVIDESALKYSSVYISGGTRGLEIEIGPRDLVRACQGDIGAIAT